MQSLYGVSTKILESDGDVINPATQENQATQIANQEEMITAIGNISITGIPADKAIESYSYQVKSITATHKYFFFEDGAENWAIKRKTLSSGVFDYAKGTGGYGSVYDTPTTAPIGVITWGTYGEIFDNVGAGSLVYQTLTNTADDLQGKDSLVVAAALFGRINGAVKPIMVDKSSQSLVEIDFAHSKIHAGEHFYRKDWIDISGSATVDFLLNVPDTTEIPHMTISFSFEAEANITVYEGTTVSAEGTALSSFNRNRNSLNTAETTLFSGPTVTSVGNIIARYKAGSGKSVGGEIRAEAELMLKTNTKYLVRVTNDTVSANWCDYLADWYEQTPLN